MTDTPANLTTPAATAAIAVAQDAQSLITGLKAVDPALAEQLIGKPLAYSKTPWGTALAGLIGLLATKYGLACSVTVVAANCLTPDTINLVAGIAGLVGAWAGSYVMRYVTKAPIASILPTSTTQGPTP